MIALACMTDFARKYILTALRFRTLATTPVVGVSTGASRGGLELGFRSGAWIVLFVGPLWGVLYGYAVFGKKTIKDGTGDAEAPFPAFVSAN
jgi:hypothetical protein